MSESRAAHVAVALLLVAVLLASCDGSGAVEPDPIEECPGDVVTLSLTTDGAVPEFRWAPSCPMAWLEIHDANGIPAWVVTGEGRNVIRSGVRYGTPPENATQLQEARPLISGARYRAAVHRAEVGDGSVQLVGGGALEFTIGEAQ